MDEHIMMGLTEFVLQKPPSLGVLKLAENAGVCYLGWEKYYMFSFTNLQVKFSMFLNYTCR